MARSLEKKDGKDFYHLLSPLEAGYMQIDIAEDATETTYTLSTRIHPYEKPRKALSDSNPTGAYLSCRFLTRGKTPAWEYKEVPIEIVEGDIVPLSPTIGTPEFMLNEVEIDQSTVSFKLTGLYDSLPWKGNSKSAPYGAHKLRYDCTVKDEFSGFGEGVGLVNLHPKEVYGYESESKYRIAAGGLSVGKHVISCVFYNALGGNKVGFSDPVTAEFSNDKVYFSVWIDEEKLEGKYLTPEEKST
ncbi:MAG: hypothetical protein Q4P06_08870 [Actinomycetaceae bacterium]|nr:hypothetical protein [Actinomycetaceae bacterium]